jgi:hypothetical protein
MCATRAFAFIFGLLPLWLALGAGGLARQVIGTVTEAIELVHEAAAEQRLECADPSRGA